MGSSFIHLIRTDSNEFFLMSVYVPQLSYHQNTYIIKGKTDHQPRLDAWDKCSGLVHWEDPEGWSGEGGGRGDRDGEHM